MTPLRVGQQVEIDLFGLHLPGGRVLENGVVGIVVALDPGAITVRLGAPGFAPEVTVSQRRVIGVGA